MSEETTTKKHFEETREHVKAAHEAFEESVEACLPKGWRESRRKMRREMLLAMRSMINVAIDHIDAKEHKAE